MTPGPNRMRFARSAAAAMKISGELMISLPAEWCSPSPTSSKPTASRCSMNSRSRCNASVGLVPARWNGAMKYPNLSLAIEVPLRSSCPNHNATCPPRGQKGSLQILLGWGPLLAFLGDQLPQRHAVGLEQLRNARLVHLGDDDLADLRIHLAEDAVGLHLLGLIEVVLGRRHVVHRFGLEPVHQPEVDQRHQPLLAQLFR